VASTICDFTNMKNKNSLSIFIDIIILKI